MKIARGMNLAALSLLILCATASAQTTSTDKNHKRIITTNSVCSAPNLALSTASAIVRLPCSEGGPSYCTPTPNQQVQVLSNVTGAEGGTLTYKYSTTGGRIVGDGPDVVWDFSGAEPGRYSVTVEVDNNCGCDAFATTNVLVERCPSCPPCPSVAVTCPTSVPEGSPVTFAAAITGGASTLSPTYNWTVSAGSITSGQGTPSITVDSNGLGGQSVTATVVVAGIPAECGRTASCSFSFPPKPLPQGNKFDQYPDVNFNDEKARLDNYAIQLQNEPGSKAYLLSYGAASGPSGVARGNRARDYLVNTRGIDAGRIVVLDGGCRQDMTVELWLVPSGANPPAPDMSMSVPCGPRTTLPGSHTRRGGRRNRLRA